jgi:PAS domain S-box-containing protein
MQSASASFDSAADGPAASRAIGLRVGPRTRTLLGAVATAVAYGAAARAGAALSFPNTPLSAFWTANAILLAALMLSRRRDWWIYVALVLPVHLVVQVLFVHIAPLTSLISYVGNCAVALVGAWGMREFAPHVRRVDHFQTAVMFIVIAGVLAPLVTSLVLAATYVALNISHAFWLTAIGRSLTNSFAILTLVPVILHGAAWIREGSRTIRTARAMEASLLMVGLAVLSILAFVAPPSVPALSSALLYAPYAMLLWAASRFGVAGASVAVLMLGFAAVYGTLNNVGPFVGHTPVDSAVSLLVFLVLTSVSLLMLAATLEERALLERSGAASEERFRTLFAHNIVPTVIWNSDGRILDANESFLQLTGLDRDALRQRRTGLDALVVRSDGVSLRGEASVESLTVETPPVERELIVRDGRQIPVLMAGFRFPGSAAEGTTCLFDLTSLRRAESERRQAELLHSAVLASVHDQIVVLDRTGVIIATNQSWRQFVEHSATRPFERGHVGDHYVQACQAAASAGDSVAAELLECIHDVLGGVRAQRHLEFSRGDSEGPLWYEISVERLQRPEGGVVISRADVTTRKQALNQAREQRQQLAHLSRVAILGELSGAFAHELAQPLTSILGNAEAALQLLPGNAPNLSEVQEILRDIIKDDVRAAEVIQRLRSMLARGEIRRQVVDLNQIAYDALAIARGDLISRNVTATLQLEPKGAPVFADPVQLQQVLLNLIVNACDAMADAPTADRRLAIATHAVDGGLAIECSVTDSGPGIGPNIADRLFQPFVTTKKHGMGLGLAICRSIIEAHGGRLWAENSGGSSGAVFRFTAKVAA